MAKKKAGKREPSVFVQLGLKNADELEQKSTLVCEILHIMKARGLTDRSAARKMGIRPKQLYDLASGELRGFSVEQLERLVEILRAPGVKGKGGRHV